MPRSSRAGAVYRQSGGVTTLRTRPGRREVPNAPSRARGGRDVHAPDEIGAAPFRGGAIPVREGNFQNAGAERDLREGRSTARRLGRRPHIHTHILIVQGPRQRHTWLSWRSRSNLCTCIFPSSLRALFRTPSIPVMTSPPLQLLRRTRNDSDRSLKPNTPTPRALARYLKSIPHAVSASTLLYLYATDS